MNKRRIAAVVEDHVGGLARPVEDAAAVIPIFLAGFALEGEDRNAGLRRSPRRRDPGSRRCCRTPSAPGAEMRRSVSISTAVWIVMWSEPVMRAPLSGLRLAEFLAHRHQARHLDLGHVDFLAAPIGELDIGDVIIAGMIGPFDVSSSGESDQEWICGGAAGYSSRHAAMAIRYKEIFIWFHVLAEAVGDQRGQRVERRRGFLALGRDMDGRAALGAPASSVP